MPLLPSLPRTSYLSGLFESFHEAFSPSGSKRKKN